MKIAVLWTELSGYMNACLKKLAAMDGVELFVASSRINKDAPFDELTFAWIENHFQWHGSVDANRLIPLLENFQPELILCANWHYQGYRKTLRHFKGQSIRVFTSDRPWMGTPRQWLGIFISRFYLHPICEAIFVAGERQSVFAKKMGFSQKEILQGLYSCDHEKFASIYFERKKQQLDPRSFLFVGRFVSEKGLDTLVDAYKRYHKQAADPWPLKCYGAGPLQPMLDGIPGIECKGFCQPDDLPKKFMEANCLILPSTFEPWALVVHEATAAGLAVIASDAVGATVHLIQDDYNGYIIETGSAEELAGAMLNYSALSPAARHIMSENGYLMSLQFTPRRWAETVLSIPKRINGKIYEKPTIEP